MSKDSLLPPSYDEAINGASSSAQSSSSSTINPPGRPNRPYHRPQPKPPAPTPVGDYNNNPLLPFNYPSNHFCQKCKNSGFKVKNGKVCHDCWDRFFLRSKAYNPNPELPFRYPQGFICDRCNNTGYKRRSGRTCQDCWERFSARNNYQPAPPIMTNPLDMLFGSTYTTSIFTGPMGTSQSFRVLPGDPRIGGILCGRCRGSGLVHVFLDEDLCPVCLGLGRVINGAPPFNGTFPQQYNGFYRR